MSLSDRDKVRLEHILTAARKAVAFASDGARDEKTAAAVERMIEIVGEAARHTSEELRANYPDIPWSNIVGMRNMLVHEYFRVDKATVWDTVDHKLPAIIDWMAGILAEAS